MTAPTAIEVTSYTELIAAIEAGRVEMGLRQLDFEVLISVTQGHWGKAAGLLQVKKFGIEKIFDALRGAGLRLSVEIDPEQRAKMKQRIAENFNPMQANQARPSNHASAISSHVLSRAFGHILREARKQRWAGKSKAERSDHARKIANVRWSKVRKRKKALQRRRQRAKMVEVSAGAVL